MLKNISVFTALACALVGCASTTLMPEANTVIVSPSRPPKGCKYLGHVIGNQGNFFTGAWTSNRNLELGAMNDLRNQAAKLGANYVQLTTNRAGFTASNSAGEQTNVTNTGGAYRCPAESLGQ